MDSIAGKFCRSVCVVIEPYESVSKCQGHDDAIAQGEALGKFDPSLACIAVIGDVTLLKSIAGFMVLVIVMPCPSGANGENRIAGPATQGCFVG